MNLLSSEVFYLQRNEQKERITVKVTKKRQKREKALLEFGDQQDFYKRRMNVAVSEIVSFTPPFCQANFVKMGYFYAPIQKGDEIMEQSSRLLLKEEPLIINKELAACIGLNEAIFLQQMEYWLSINKKLNRNFYDDRYWTYNTLESWQKENFPFWAVSTIQRTIKSLRKTGLLLTGNYNKKKFDRTIWYSIDYDKLNEIDAEFQKVKEESTDDDPPETPNGEGEEPDQPEKEEVPEVENEKQGNEEEVVEEIEDCIPESIENAHVVNMTISSWSKRPNGCGQPDRMDMVNLTEPIPETYPETISEKSVSQSEKQERTTDGQNQKKNNDRIPLNPEPEKLARLFERANINLYQGTHKKALVKAIESLWICESIKTNDGQQLNNRQIREKLGELTMEAVDHALFVLRRADENKPIKNPHRYLQPTILTAIDECDAADPEILTR